MLVTQVTMWGNIRENFETSTQTLQNFQTNFALSGFSRLSRYAAYGDIGLEPGVPQNFGEFPERFRVGRLVSGEPCRCADARSLIGPTVERMARDTCAVDVGEISGATMAIQAGSDARHRNVLGFLAFCHGVTGAALGVLLVIVVIEARRAEPVLDRFHGNDTPVGRSHAFIERVTGGALPLHGRA